MEWGSLMILPIVVSHSSIKSTFVIGILTGVEYEEFIPVLFLEESVYLNIKDT